ncbi:MAG: MFS transporter [Gammaproteobacteria bacterium]|nr:MFS transporter [Gammaproteobacteria bacterium]
MGQSATRVTDSSALKNQRTALVMLVTSAFALPLMLSAVNVALPAMALDLKMNAVLLSWVPLAFLTASAASVLAFGRLADMVGRKRIFTLGTVGLLITSVLLALAPNAETLLALRVLQAVTAAMLYATQVSILSSIYPPDKRGAAIGVLVSSVYFGLTCGPVIGGWLVEHLSWRATFVAHVPLTLLVLLFGLPRVKGEWKAEHRGSFDWTGAALYAGSIVSLMWGGSTLPTFKGIALMGLGALGLAVFFRHQHAKTDPLFDVSLFYTNRVFTLSSIAALLMYATTYSTLVLMSLYLQFLKGLTPTQAGMIMLAQPLVSAVMSPLAGRLSDRIEPRVIASLGMGITGFGLLLLAQLEAATSLGHVITCLVITGFGFSLFSSPNSNAIMGAVDKRHYGVAGSAVATMRVLGQLASMGLVASAFALIIGPVAIEPSTYPKLAKAIDLSFLVAASLCLPGIACSLARGKLRPDQSIAQGHL